MSRTSKSYRIIIVADESGYEHGDYESAEDRAHVEAQIAGDGVWGYLVEKRIDGRWETVDSCFGFIGTDIDANGMADYLQSHTPAGYDIPMFIERETLAYDTYCRPARRKR